MAFRERQSVLLHQLAQRNGTEAAPYRLKRREAVPHSLPQLAGHSLVLADTKRDRTTKLSKIECECFVRSFLDTPVRTVWFSDAAKIFRRTNPGLIRRCPFSTPAAPERFAAATERVCQSTRNPRVVNTPSQTIPYRNFGARNNLVLEAAEEFAKTEMSLPITPNLPIFTLRPPLPWPREAVATAS